MKNASLNKTQKVDVRVDADILRMQESLSERLGAEVSIQHKTNGGGKLVFKYHCLDELEGILSRIK
jgi:ParB family chromosome partitioning protein